MCGSGNTMGSSAIVIAKVLPSFTVANFFWQWGTAPSPDPTTVV